MPIRPIDVRRKEFKNSFRGYDTNQVDDFLDAVADEFERSYTENSRMREEISSLRERLQQFEELEGSIRAALVHAEQAASDLRRTATQEAEDLRLSANREAEHLRKSAAQEAEFTIREAKTRSHQMLADTSARVERIQQSYEAMQEAKRTFVNDFRHLLKSYMEVMDNVEDRKSTRLNSSHANISYAVFCLKKKSYMLCYALELKSPIDLMCRCDAALSPLFCSTPLTAPSARSLYSASRILLPHVYVRVRCT